MLSLWQSGRFTKTAKIIWTLAVILIAFLGIVALTFMASSMNQFMAQAGRT